MIDSPKIPGETVNVRSGELLELWCESDTGYHWCYWEHGDKKYSTHNDDDELVTELFTWVRSDTACGVSISSVQVVHQGEF